MDWMVLHSATNQLKTCAEGTLDGQQESLPLTIYQIPETLPLKGPDHCCSSEDSQSDVFSVEISPWLVVNQWFGFCLLNCKSLGSKKHVWQQTVFHYFCVLLLHSSGKFTCITHPLSFYNRANECTLRKSHKRVQKVHSVCTVRIFYWSLITDGQGLYTFSIFIFFTFCTIARLLVNFFSDFWKPKPRYHLLLLIQCS